MSEPVALPPILTDRYRVEQQLGQGGMATVYLAHDIKLDRKVALKVLRPELGAVLGTERFLAEVKITAQLDHPHILTLIDSGNAGGLLYYVLPYVRGESLRDLLNRETQLSVERALEITRHVGSALDYAHRNGVVHRDIKPENILLQEGEAMLADFGIALAVKEAGGNRLTETGLSLGTPQYMSPEQATGDRTLDARSDVYSLAAVLYEMLTGDPPITGKTVQAVMAKLLTEMPTHVRTVRPTVPETVDAAVTKALSKVPADRFASAGEFLAALTTNAMAATAPATTSANHTVSNPRRARNVGMLIGAAATIALLVVLGAKGEFGGRRVSATLRDRTQLTFSGTAYSPSASADGKQIAFISRECSGARCTYSVQLQDVGATLTRRVVEGMTAAYAIELAADRRNLIVNGTIGDQYGYYLVPTLGGTPRLISPGTAAFFAGGDSIITTDGNPHPDSSFILRIESLTGAKVDSLRLPGPGTGIGALMSIPGSSRFVVMTTTPPRGFWRVLDRNGKVTDQIYNACTCGGMAASDAVWMVRSGPTVTEALVRVAVDGSGHFATQQDTIYSGTFTGGGVTTDGTTLFVDEGSDEYSAVALPFADLVAGRMPASGPIIRSTSPGAILVSPDGGRLLLGRRVPQPDGTVELRVAVRAFEGGDEHAIALTGRIRLADWIDSTTLAVITSTDTSWRVTRVDARTGAVGEAYEEKGPTPQTIVGVANGWVWLPSDARSTIVTLLGGKRRAMRAPSYFASIFSLDVSPDGSRLAYAGWSPAGDEFRVDVASLADGTPVEWLRQRAEGGYVHWNLDGSLLLAINVGPEEVRLERVSGPGQRQRLAEIPRPVRRYSFSRDLERAAIGWVEHRGDVYQFRVVK